MRIAHATIALLMLAVVAHVACSMPPAAGDRFAVLPVVPLLLLFVSALIYTVPPLHVRATDAKARRIVLGVVVGVPDSSYARFTPKDGVRLLWMFYFQRKSPARSLLVASTLLFWLFPPIQPMPWTPTLAFAIVLFYALDFPSQRRAVRWIARQLAWLDKEQERIRRTAQLPAYLTRPPWTVWDPVCGLPLFRIAAALFAAIVFVATWPHFSAAVADFLPALLLVPFIYMLVIVAVLGRSWRKGLPRWLRGEMAVADNNEANRTG